MTGRLRAIVIILLGLVSCTKVTQETRSNSGEVNFVAWNYKAATRITGPVFPREESFGAYAWAGGAVFMDDETITYQDDDTWKPSVKYLWPSGQTVDFFCYYPAHMGGLEVSPNRVYYSGIDVHTMQQDILYSSMAVGYTSDPESVEGASVSGIDGVPALFRHALAKVQVMVLVPYIHKEEPDGTITDWDVKVGTITLSGIKNKGSCELLLPEDEGPGPVSWTLPSDEHGYHVWTSDGDTVSVSNDLSTTELPPGQKITAIEDFYVLPQALSPDGQQVSIELDIKTTRNGVLIIDEQYTATANLYRKSLPAWQMNQAVTYVLYLSPTVSNGSGGNPDNPATPDDPDLSDAIITFDPATSGWENIGLETSINL